ARGLTGEGVLLCILDTGFETDHDCLESLDYLAMRDFINGDSIVSFEQGEDSSDQQYHGTLCLSAAAGLDSGSILGPAFGAQWMLAKTEYVPTETEVEEDYYVAGMEWADSAGVDITSSSLGYIDWYTQDQMDGHTTVVAQAVTEAQRRGILVVTAQGNERGSMWNAVISPADADSILAIGGVDSLGGLSGFSSPGPTADGRIKPDCAAQGSDVYCAAAYTQDVYFRASGTSLATPIAAGIAALVMEAHPDWTAQQVREAMMMSASQAETPDNDFGWGILSAPNAVDYEFSAVTPRAAVPANSSLIAFPNPANGLVTVSLQLSAPNTGSLVLFDLLGRQVMNWGSLKLTAGEHRVQFDIESLSSGRYFLNYAGDHQMTTPIVILK
ncbi:MAG: S8 family peptidase, partial [bacterium]|nr:S8 family peptidase [bacterium]